MMKQKNLRSFNYQSHNARHTPLIMAYCEARHRRQHIHFVGHSIQGAVSSALLDLELSEWGHLKKTAEVFIARGFYKNQEDFFVWF